MEPVILTPIYKGTIYKYHRCSNCEGKIYFEEDYCIPFHFEENIKYCPFCGKEVIRYAKPEYEEKPNWDWMDKFKKVLDEAEDKIMYELFCKMNREERNELIDKTNFGIEYFGSPIFWNDNTNLCRIVKQLAHRKPHYTEINKIKKKVEE